MHSSSMHDEHTIHCRSSNGTNISSIVDSSSDFLTIQAAEVAHTTSSVTYMVVFQDAVPATKIDQLCSSADANYGFTCAQIFSKTFKGFSTTVSPGLLLLYSCAQPIGCMCAIHAVVQTQNSTCPKGRWAVHVFPLTQHAHHVNVLAR